MSEKTSDLYIKKLEPCLNQQSCFIPRIKEAIPTGNNTECHMSKRASVYIQYECKAQDDMLRLKRRTG